MATRTLAILNQKGGTGKTTTAVNLAAGFAEKNFRTLLIDMDPQGAVGTSLGIAGSDAASKVLAGLADPRELAVPIRSNLDVVPSNESLLRTEYEMAKEESAASVFAGLSTALADYEFVVFDCPPTLNLIDQLVLAYVREVVSPVGCDYLSLVAVRQIVRMVETIPEKLGHPVQITGVLPTFFDGRNRISHQVVDALNQYFGDKVMPAIRLNTRLREAPSVRKTIFEFDKRSSGAADYLAAVDWLLARSPKPAPRRAL